MKSSKTAISSQSAKADDLAKYVELFEKGFISEEDGESNSNDDKDFNSDNAGENYNFCTNCGFQVENDAKFSSSCGNKLN